MKNFIYFLLINVFFISLIPNTQAQTTAFCKDKNTETITEICFDSDNSSGSKQRAIEQFKDYMLSGYTCKTDNCPRPPRSKCGPRIISHPEPTREDGQWCFEGDVEWECTKCTAIIPADTAPSDSDDSDVAPMLESDEGVFHSESSKTFATIQTLAPNPSTGIVQLDVQITNRTVKQITVQVSDISGKVVWSEKYSNIFTPTFSTQLDLSHVARGIYFTSVFANQKLIGTSKLSIQ